MRISLLLTWLRIAVGCAVVAVLVLLILNGPHENKENQRGFFVMLGIFFAGGFAAGTAWSFPMLLLAAFITGEAYQASRGLPDATDPSGLALGLTIIFVLTLALLAVAAGALASKLLLSCAIALWSRFGQARRVPRGEAHLVCPLVESRLV